MRSLTTVALALVIGSAQLPPSAPRLDVRADFRIELMAIIARLAGYQQFDTRTLPQHAAAIDTYFAPYKDHPAVVEARRLQKERDFGFDAVINFAVHLTAFPELKPRRPFVGSELERLTPQDAERFAPLVAAFAAETNAARFFAERKPVFDAAVRRMRASAETELDQSWFASFFGRPSALILAVALNNGQVAYGVRYHGMKGEREGYAVMNALQLDEDGLPVLSAAYVPTIVHEFNHSYVNPVVEKHLEEIRGAGEAVMKHVETEMKQRGYPQIRTLVSESLVRAAVVRYKRAHLGDVAARGEITRQELLGFYWMGELDALLGRYEAQRGKYKTFEEFFPEVVTYYTDLAPRMPEVLAAFEAKRPKLVEMTPVNGATDVDPATTRLVFRFDRPMRNSWAVIPGPRGRDAFPDVSVQAWDASRTTFTMTVTLKPGSTYEFTMNSATASGFFNEDGIPLAPTPVKFTTRVGR